MEIKQDDNKVLAAIVKISEQLASPVFEIRINRADAMAALGALEAIKTSADQVSTDRFAMVVAMFLERHRLSGEESDDLPAAQALIAVIGARAPL
jgi:hypothetical protein